MGSLGLLRHWRRYGMAIVALTVLPAVSANAQEWEWAVRISTGAFVPTGAPSAVGAGTTLDVRSTGVLSIDVVRSLGCSVEAFAAGLIVLNSPVATIVDGQRAIGGTISPGGMQLGVSFKPCQRSWGELYFGPLLGVFERDRSTSQISSGQTRTFGFPTSWGIGAQAGYRRSFSDHVALDIAFRWQRYRVFIEDGSLAINPIIAVGGLLIRY